MHERGDDEEIDELLKIEASNAVFGNFAAFVADDCDAQSVDGLEPFHQIDGVLVRLGLFEQVGLEIFGSEGSGLVENDLPQIFIEGHLAFLVDVVGDVVAVIDFFVVEAESGSQFACEDRCPIRW